MAYTIRTLILPVALASFLSLINAVSGASCSRTLLVSPTSPSNPTISIARSNSGVQSLKGSSTTKVTITKGVLHTFSFSPAPKALKIFFGKENGCYADASLALKSPKGYHWELATISGNKPCLASDTDPACSISTGALCQPNPIYRLKIGGKTRSTVVLNLVKGSYDGC